MHYNEGTVPYHPGCHGDETCLGWLVKPNSNQQSLSLTSDPLDVRASCSSRQYNIWSIDRLSLITTFLFILLSSLPQPYSHSSFFFIFFPFLLIIPCITRNAESFTHYQKRHACIFIRLHLRCFGSEFLWWRRQSISREDPPSMFAYFI